MTAGISFAGDSRQSCDLPPMAAALLLLLGRPAWRARPAGASRLLGPGVRQERPDGSTSGDRPARQARPEQVGRHRPAGRRLRHSGRQPGGRRRGHPHRAPHLSVRQERSARPTSSSSARMASRSSASTSRSSAMSPASRTIIKRFIPTSDITVELLNDNVVLTGTVDTPLDAKRAPRTRQRSSSPAVKRRPASIRRPLPAATRTAASPSTTRTRSAGSARSSTCCRSSARTRSR